MNYKQKYEQALEYMRKVYPTLNGADKEDAEHYFPELKESEDERIRKSIIKLLQRGGYMSPEDKDKAFAWLEKQGEHQEYPKDVIDNAISFLANRNNGMSEEDAKDIVNAIITVLTPSYWPKRCEQKPAWSEEDKKMIDTIIYDLERHGGKEDSCYSAEINWLKSLKEK